MSRRHIVFLVNLLQDVNIVRPLALLAARDMDVSVAFLVSDRFYARDKHKTWAGEIDRLASDIGAELIIFDGPYFAFQWLSGRHGTLVAPSESSLSAHAEVHAIFQVAPPAFVRVTLQHGLECVGFLHNRQHDAAHGRAVRFGADLVAGWLPASSMVSMAASERSKLVVTGPPLVLQPPPPPRRQVAEGLICENLHSVRMNANGDIKAGFMDTFFAFAERLALDEARVALRPHPGGQYVIRNKIALPPNVTLENDPIYRTDLSAFRYGVSAPSSVVLDMVLADIPTAVWRDQDGVMDTRHYDGLTSISTLDDWLAFRRDALIRPEMILGRQRRYLEALGIPIQVEDVRARFLNLLEGSSRRWSPPRVERPVQRLAREVA